MRKDGGSVSRRYQDRCRIAAIASRAVVLCEGGTSIAIPQLRRQRPTGGIGGLGGSGSGGGMGLGGVGVGAGLGFCGAFIALNIQRSMPSVQNSTPDVQIRNQRSTIKHLFIAAICRKPGKLGCSRRQIPRPFDN